VHDLLLLWRRKQPYDYYIEQVTCYSVREVREEALRRRCVVWMARHFAPSRSASTLAQNVWASYSHHFDAKALAPAYLAHLIMREPLLRQLTTALHGRVSPGMSLGRTRLGDVAAVPGALEALLRTLQQWGVLAADPRQGGYVVEGCLCVAPPLMPLLVWCWWLDTRQPCIPLEEFAQMPLWTWIETEGFASGWQRYAGRLWTVERDAGVPTLYLHPTDTGGFTRALLNLLSIDGRKGRQLPRYSGEEDDEETNKLSVSAVPVIT
jgi:hypothetical protein